MKDNSREEIQKIRENIKEAELVLVDGKVIPYFFHRKTEEVKVKAAPPKAKPEKKVQECAAGPRPR